MFGWFSGDTKKEGDSANPPRSEGGPAANAPANADQGMFGGAFNFMKGIFGMDQLKVEETDGVNKTDIDEGKRKGLFSLMSSYIGKDITSMISLPVWIFEPVSFLQVMSEPLQYEYLLRKVNLSLDHGASLLHNPQLCIFLQYLSTYSQAAEASDPLDRLVYMAAFNCALYSSAIRTRMFTSKSI
jgi:Oxysterol-binding protein